MMRRTSLRIPKQEIPQLIVLGLSGAALLQWLYFVALDHLPGVDPPLADGDQLAWQDLAQEVGAGRLALDEADLRQVDRRPQRCAQPRAPVVGEADGGAQLSRLAVVPRQVQPARRCGPGHAGTVRRRRELDADAAEVVAQLHGVGR